MNKPENENILKIPQGMASIGPVDNVTEAYLKSILALPDRLKEITDALDNIDSNLSVIALYCEKKGLSENLFAPDDFDGGENGK